MSVEFSALSEQQLNELVHNIQVNTEERVQAASELTKRANSQIKDSKNDLTQNDIEAFPELTFARMAEAEALSQTFTPEYLQDYLSIDNSWANVEKGKFNAILWLIGNDKTYDEYKAALKDWSEQDIRKTISVHLTKEKVEQLMKDADVYMDKLMKLFREGHSCPMVVAYKT